MESKTENSRTQFRWTNRREASNIELSLPQMRCSCHICPLPVSLSLCVLHVARELLHVNKLEFDGSQLGYNWTAQCSRIMSRERERGRQRKDCGMQLQFVARQGAWHIWPHLQNYTKCTKLFAKSISCSNNKNNKNCTKTEKLTSSKTNKGRRQRREGRRQGKNWKLKTEITTKNVVLFFCSLLFCEYVNTQIHTHAQVAQTNTERTMLQHARQLVKATIYSL